MDHEQSTSNFICLSIVYATKSIDRLDSSHLDLLSQSLSFSSFLDFTSVEEMSDNALTAALL